MRYDALPMYVHANSQFKIGNMEIENTLYRLYRGLICFILDINPNK